MSVCFTMCVWSWPVQRSWLLKGQSVCVSPADSTLLSPDCVSVCGNCFLFFSPPLSFSPTPIPCVSACVHTCVLCFCTCARARLVCDTGGDELKRSLSPRVSRSPADTSSSAAAASCRPVHSWLCRELPPGRLHDPWPRWYKSPLQHAATYTEVHLALIHSETEIIEANNSIFWSLSHYIKRCCMG